MNASVVQKVNLASMSVEEMERTVGGWGWEPILLGLAIDFVLNNSQRINEFKAGFTAGWNAGG